MEALSFLPAYVHTAKAAEPAVTGDALEVRFDKGSTNTPVLLKSQANRTRVRAIEQLSAGL